MERGGPGSGDLADGGGLPGAIDPEEDPAGDGVVLRAEEGSQ